MKDILVANAGSSSVNFQVFAVDGDGRLARSLKGQMNRHNVGVAETKDHCVTSVYDQGAHMPDIMSAFVSRATSRSCCRP